MILLPHMRLCWHEQPLQMSTVFGSPSLQSLSTAQVAPQRSLTQYELIGGGLQLTGFWVQEHEESRHVFAAELVTVVESRILFVLYSFSFLSIPQKSLNVWEHVEGEQSPFTAHVASHWPFTQA
jgi:hypothetical protein